MPSKNNKPEDESPLKDVIDVDWGKARQDVDELDRRFDTMQRQLQNFDLRVLKYGSDGRVTDVTDKVSPSDLRPENIKDFTADTNVNIPRNPDGSVDRKAALNLLKSVFASGLGRHPNLTLGMGQKPQESTSERVIREIEIVISDAEKTLEHWKR